MSNINLRLYGEQIFPNITKYLTTYISPEISKEEFLSSYKKGLIEIKDLKLKEKFLIHPQILIEEMIIGSLKIKIPDDKENLEIKIDDLKCFISISELDDREIEKIMINERKKSIDDFMKYAINKIEKKDGPSFFDNIIKSVIEKIINGFTIDIINLELKISLKKNKNIFLIFNFDNANFVGDKGINFKNMSFIYQEDLMKKTVIEKFDFNIDIEFENQENNIKNKLIIYISDIKFQISKNIYLQILYLYELFKETEYKKVYLKYKKLIQYHRPKERENGKKDFNSLWKYSIKTIIKLQKYVQNNEENIFDLKFLNQIKIIEQYLENNTDDENILLPDLKNILKNTKKSVEKKVLENKNNNFFAKSFSFFFSKKEEDTKEVLTDEEKQLSSEIYEDENIAKYLKKEFRSNTTNFSSIINKIKIFFLNFSLEINFQRFELILSNSSGTQSLFLKGMKYNLNYFNKELDFSLFINDIGYDKEKSILQKKDIFCGDVIVFKKDKQNHFFLNFGFNNIELNEELFVFLFSFYNSIKTEKKVKLFHKKNQNLDQKNDNKEEIIKNIQNFSFINNFKISNIPSFSIKCKENKIDFIISNYSLTENSINFTLSIKDSHSIILNNFIISPKKENNKFIFHLESPVEINLLSESSKFFFLSYLKYKREIANNNYNSHKQIKSNELFGFNYKSYRNIDLGKLNIDEYTFDMIINKISIKIFEEKENYLTNLVFENFTFLYKNKNLDINLNKIIISTNVQSTILLYMIDFESPLLKKYIEKVNFVAKDANDILSMASGVESKDNKNDFNENNLNIENIINYSKLLEEILNLFNFKLDNFCFEYQSDKFVLTLNLNNIKVSKQKDSKEKIILCSEIGNWNLSFESPKINIKNKKIIENNQKILISYELNVEIFKGKMKSVYLNMGMEDVLEIWDNTKFILNQINWDIILCKIDIEIDDFIIIFDQFKYSISKILFINFKENEDKDNAFYIKFFEFLMTNQKEDKIIYEKELNIDYYFTSSTENDMNIKFNNVNIKISQHDISFLLSNIKSRNKNNEKIHRKETFVPNNSSTKFKINDNINLLDQGITKSDNNLNKIQSRMSMDEQMNKKEKKFSISLVINIPKLNLCFCLNDYKKVEEITLESTNLKLRNIFYENSISHETSNELNYSLFFGKLNFAFFYSENNTFNILSKRKAFKDNCNQKTQIDEIKIENEDKNIINKNQVEIINDKNGYKINVNQNEVNIRIDAFIMIYYYFKGAIPLEKMIDNFENSDLYSKDENKCFQIQINFNDSQFKLSTSFSGKENLFLDINKFIIIYSGVKNLPFGSYIITLNQISAKIIGKNNIRELFVTKNDFLQIKMTLSEQLISAIIEMDTLKINLSYRDLISFLRAYIMNFKILNDEIKNVKEFLKNMEINLKNNNQDNHGLKNKKENKKDLINLNKEKTLTPKSKLFISQKFVFTGELNFEKLDITLIDNSKGSYRPFMNIINNKIYLILNPDESIETSFSFQLFSYNYIACVWEPTIENIKIKFSNLYVKRDLEISNKFKLEVNNNININLSDMAISFTLVSLNNLLEKFSQKKKKFQTEKIDKKQLEITDSPKNISKITNNQIINYTGIEFKISYNGKMIDCPLLKPVELDYINEYNKSQKKSRYITLIYDEKNKFEIPLEKIVTLIHTINNEISFISDNIISENRTINIFLYSTIMFKNKSIYPLQITIENKIGRQAYLVSNPNSMIGIPLNLINKDNNFNFMLIKTKNEKNKENSADYSQNFNIGALQDIKTDIEYKDSIKFKKKHLLMKLDHSIHNVRTIIINTEYSIVNCLPCNLTIRFSQKKDVIKKCTQYYIDEYFGPNLYVAFSINTGSGEFTCEGFDIYSFEAKKSEEKFLIFSSDKNQSFKILYDFKQNDEENTLIIYAEYILHNKTGIEFFIHSKDYNNNMLCFNIDKSICLITSKFDYKEAYLQLGNEKFISHKIKLSSIIEKSPYSEIDMRNELGDKLKFNIKKKFSYINIINNPNFKDNIMSIIFILFPSCKITNLLPDKRFFVCDFNFKNNYQIIKPYDESNFFFFGHGSNAQLGISVLNMTTTKCTHLIKFKFEIGVYTLTTFEETFNLEIRKNPSNGCLDVFVIQNNLENSKIIMENLSEELINIYQKGYEKYMQILEVNQKQTLKIYNYECPDFTIETSNSVCELKFDIMEEQEKKIKLNNKIILLIQANGIKMKLVFYSIEKFSQLKLFTNINTYEIRINSIIFSLIGDNEFQDKKLIKYHRYELLLFILTELWLNITIEKTSGVLSKNSIKSVINLNNFQIHNQISQIGKFPCILRNTEAFLSIYSEMDYYEKLKIIKVKTNNIIISKLELGIDPTFFIELIDFFGNILYRMNITNFIINELFQIKNDKKNEQEKIECLIKEYDESNILLNALNFEIPEINIRFELTNYGIKELLKQRIGCSDILYWLAKGLVGRGHSLKLDTFKYPYNNGGLGYFFKGIFYNIRAKLENKLTDIGLKGFIGKFKNIFSIDEQYKKDKITKRFREKRAFYGKFKYFKEYDENDAYLMNNFFEKYKYLRKYYPLHIIRGFKIFYLFTTLSMIIIEYTNFNLINNIDYFYIKNARAEKLEVKIEYNQVIDSADNYTILCENEDIAINVSKSLNEEVINNKEIINEI